MKKIESEKLLERSLKSAVENTMNGLCLKLLSQHTTGLPDRLCLLPGGKLFFAELKTTGKKPRKIQAYIHQKLRGLGFQVYTLDTSEKIQSVLNSSSKSTKSYLNNDGYDFGHNVNHSVNEDY